MAQQGNQVHRVKLSCSICLDLLKDSVTIPCGHSYCMSCIKHHWDTQEASGIYCCPQCWKGFNPRPELVKNIVLAELVEDLKKDGLQDAPADRCYAGPGDVACDFCTGRKVKAAKSCSVCLASYCEKHLQPHFDEAPLKKQKLEQPCENICSDHNEVTKMFCSVDQHKGDDTVSAAAERAERQKELDRTRLVLQQEVRDGEKRAKLLRREADALKGSADAAVDHSDEVFGELIRELQKRSSEVKEQIRARREAEETRVKESLERVEQEVAELRRRDAQLEQLAHTQDHDRFLLDYVSLSTLGPTTHRAATADPLGYFEDVTAGVSRVRGQIEDILAQAVTGTIQAEPEPASRADFLKYRQEIKLDPNTANEHLLLPFGNIQVLRAREEQACSYHPDRFTHWSQVLSTEGLTGRCYWEVEVFGKVHVAVTYKNISRAGNSNQSKLGFNDKSWMLVCNKNSHMFFHNNIQTAVSTSGSTRVGVYLDHSAGVLSFYRVSDTMTLLHRVQTTFTRPLYAGICLYYAAGAIFC